MSRISDDRKDLFKRDNTAMTSSSTIRNIHNLGATMEKEKIDKGPFTQHNFVNDASFRNHDLIKPLPKNQPTRIVTTSAASGSIQHHSIPPLMPNYIAGPGHLVNTVPINHAPIIRSTIRSGTHAFQTHMPVGIGTGSGLGSPRAAPSSQRSSLPSLKPANIPSQIQLPINPISGLSTIIPPNITNRTGSPRVPSTHVLASEGCIDRGKIITAEPHIRGNIQANHTSPATIQVIATGTTFSQTHLPSTFLNKSSNLTSNTSMLKISVSSHSNTNPPGGISISTFKLGLGKTFGPSTNIIIPTTSSTSRPDIQEVRQVVGSSPYIRFPVNPNISLSSHHISKQTTPSSLTQPTVSISSGESRHTVGVPYHPISTAYVFHHDMGLHGFPHQLLRPATTSINSLPTFMPIVSIAVSTSKASVQKIPGSNQDVSRSEGLTIQTNANYNIQNLYPPSSPASVTVVSSAAISSSTIALFDSSVRPSILQRKRPADAATLFPVQPTEKERVSSPMKPENLIPTKIFTPSNYLAHEKVDVKNTNHSILSLTADTKPMVSLANSLPATTNVTHSIIISHKPPPITTPSLQTSLVSNTPNTSFCEASPKKKPRKQSVVTTEDKYGPTTLSNSVKVNDSTADADEEFLKSNETMKDITPPKTSSLQTSSSSSVTIGPLNHTFLQKQLFPTSGKLSTTMSPLAKVKQENKEMHLNGMLAPLATSFPTESKPATEPAKIHVFKRKPQYGILHEYKVNSKATHSHFIRQSDVKVKEEKKSFGIADSLLTKSSIQSASGWKLHHLSEQINDIINMEKDLHDQLSNFRNDVPALRGSTSSSSYNSLNNLQPEEKQLRFIHELLQGNIQRCNYSIENLKEAKESMLTVLEHRNVVLDLLKSSKTKPKVKKKHSS